jgi:hypothetical protein
MLRRVFSFTITKPHPQGGLLVGRRYREYDEDGKMIRDEEIYHMRFGVWK